MIVTKYYCGYYFTVAVFNLKSIHLYSYQSSFVSKHLNDKMQSKIEIDAADVNQSKTDKILLAALHSNHLRNSLWVFLQDEAFGADFQYSVISPEST